jgi:DNA-directed RNA polymerase subunit RPC12/RpoP
MRTQAQTTIRCGHCEGTIAVVLESDPRGDLVSYRCDTCGCEWEWGFSPVRRGADCPLWVCPLRPASGFVECPQCAGTGSVATGMRLGLVSWSSAVRSEPCGLCDGSGEVPAGVAEEYEEAAVTDDLPDGKALPTPAHPMWWLRIKPVC